METVFIVKTTGNTCHDNSKRRATPPSKQRVIYRKKKQNGRTLLDLFFSLPSEQVNKSQTFQRIFLSFLNAHATNKVASSASVLVKTGTA